MLESQEGGRLLDRRRHETKLERQVLGRSECELVEAMGPSPDSQPSQAALADGGDRVPSVPQDADPLHGEV